jgi:hypothetical protein
VRCADLLLKWEQTYELACDRYQQANQLGVIGKDLGPMKQKLKDVEACLTMQPFANKEQLEQSILALRVSAADI